MRSRLWTILALAMGPFVVSQEVATPELRPVLWKLQKDGGETKEWMDAMGSILAQGHNLAAAAWLEKAEAAKKTGRFPPTKPDPLPSLKSKLPKPKPVAESALQNKLLLHVESSATAKDGVEVARITQVLDALFKIVPDAAAEKRVTAAKNKAPATMKLPESADVERRRTQGDALKAQALDALLARIQTGVTQYEAAGCCELRMKILEQIQWFKALDKEDARTDDPAATLRRLTTAVEPTLTLKWALGAEDGTYSVYKNGVVLDGFKDIKAETAAIQEIPVHPADLFQVVIPKTLSSRAPRRTWVLFAGGSIDQRPIAEAQYYLDRDGNAESLVTDLKRLFQASRSQHRMEDAGPELTGADGKVTSIVIHPEKDNGGIMTVPLGQTLLKQAAELSKTGFPLLWFGFESKECVITIRIPAS